jgi:hypothetical protein
MAYIYGHYTTDTDKLFYIGKGTGRRAWSNRGRNPYWKRTADKHGLSVKILHDHLSDEDAYILEAQLIAEERTNPDTILTNILEGGEGITSEASKLFAQRRSQDPTWRHNHKEGMKRMAQDPEWRRKNKERMEKMRDNPVYREKMKALGLKHSQDPAFRKRMKEQGIKNSQNPEWRQKITEANIRRSQDPAWRQTVSTIIKKKYEDPTFANKITEINRRLAQDPEWQRKNREGKQNMRPYGSEARAKIAERNRKLAQDPSWLSKIRAAGLRNSQDPEFRKKMQAITDKQKKEHTVISPSGEIHHFRGINEFCRIHGLHSYGLGRVLRKQAVQYKGWRLYEP